MCKYLPSLQSFLGEISMIMVTKLIHNHTLIIIQAAGMQHYIATLVLVHVR